MKNLAFIFMSLILLVACNNEDIYESYKHNPEPGDIFLIESQSGETVVQTYLESGSQIELSESDGNELNISFEEPGESEDYELSAYNINKEDHIDTLNFFLNGEEVSVSVIHK